MTKYLWGFPRTLIFSIILAMTFRWMASQKIPLFLASGIIGCLIGVYLKITVLFFSEKEIPAKDQLADDLIDDLQNDITEFQEKNKNPVGKIDQAAARVQKLDKKMDTNPSFSVQTELEEAICKLDELIQWFLPQYLHEGIQALQEGRRALASH